MISSLLGVVGLLLTLAIPTAASATEIESAYSVYNDPDYAQSTLSARIQRRDDFTPSLGQMVRVVGARNTIRDDGALRQMDRHVVQDSGTLNYSLFHKQYTYGILLSQTKSESLDAITTGLSFGRWFLEDTLEVSFSYNKTDIDRDTFIRYDANASALFLPAYVKGKSYSLSLTNLTTPTTILLGSYVVTKRTDRPDAHMMMLEWREALPTLSSSIHSQLSYFQNRGTIERKTDFGKIEATALKVTWNWTLPTEEKLFILGASTRYYQEAESKESFLRQVDLESTLHSFNFRYRPGAGPWTDTKNEFYVFGGRYQTSEPRAGNLFGLGTQLNF